MDLEASQRNGELKTCGVVYQKFTSEIRVAQIAPGTEISPKNLLKSTFERIYFCLVLYKGYSFG